MKKIILVLSLALSLAGAAIAQTSVADGDWIDGPTWGGTSPGYTVGNDVTINSYVIANAAVTLTGNNKTLSVNDTLIVHGDLIFTATSGAAINVGPNNVLIVMGNLDLGKNNAGANVEAGGVLVVKGNITATGTNGEFTGSGNIYTDGTTSGVTNNGTGTVETVTDLSGDGYTTIEDFVTGGGTTPLPVKLRYFKAEASQGEVLISWATSVEINNDRFEIERSEDGKYFETIATISGAGDSNDDIEYFYSDTNISSQVVYYKLKQIDFDGSEEYFKTVRVVLKKGQGHGVYPSLVSGQSIQVEGEDVVQIEVLNMKGAVLLSQQVNSLAQLQVNVNDLQNGIYFVKLISGLGEVEIHRILIQR